MDLRKNAPHKIVCRAPEEFQVNRLLYFFFFFDTENSVKDVTERYASDWLSKTKKFRIDAEWWEETLLPYKTRKKVNYASIPWKPCPSSFLRPQTKVNFKNQKK